MWPSSVAWPGNGVDDYVEQPPDGRSDDTAFFLQDRNHTLTTREHQIIRAVAAFVPPAERRLIACCAPQQQANAGTSIAVHVYPGAVFELERGRS